MATGAEPECFADGIAFAVHITLKINRKRGWYQFQNAIHASRLHLFVHCAVMEKPTPETREILDYHECVKWIEHKLGYEIRDVLNSSGHYPKWCELVGEIADGNSQEQYARYRRHQDGAIKCPEYRDWWHFLLEHRSVANPCEITIGRDLMESGLPWQNEVTAAFIDEFGDDTEYRIWW